MNRYLLVLFGLLTILVSSTSCTDQEEIGITYHHGITAEVNPFALYEECGFDWFDLSGDFFGFKPKLEINVLVYDKEGSLHQRVDTTVNTLLSFNMDLSDLDEDKYTILAIQQIVFDAPYEDEDATYEDEDAPYEDEDATYTYRAWELENISNIKDVRIGVNTKATTGIPGFMCLGIQTQEVAIRKGETIKIATEPAGSFVDVTYENLEYSKFNWSALCFGDQANGLYLNPALPEQGKYYYEDRDLLFGDYWSTVYSFYTDIISIDVDTIFFLSPGKINYCFKFAYFETYDDIDTGWLDGFWQIPYDAYFEAEKGKHYRAYCYYNPETEKFSTYMGLESSFKQWYDSLDKWNKPPFEQPYVNWGASIGEVKKYMKDKYYRIYDEWDDIMYQDYYTRDENGHLVWYDGYEAYWVSYDGKFLENDITYKFADGKLIESSFFIWNEDCSINWILQVFDNDTRYTKTERFEEVYEQSGCYMYINDLVQVEIFQDKGFDGTKYNKIKYRPRLFECTH